MIKSDGEKVKADLDAGEEETDARENLSVFIGVRFVNPDVSRDVVNASTVGRDGVSVLLISENLTVFKFGFNFVQFHLVSFLPGFRSDRSTVIRFV